MSPRWLIFAHLIFVIVWLGSASAEIVVETMLAFEKRAERQRLFIELHGWMDRILEGPGLLGTLVTGWYLLDAWGGLAGIASSEASAWLRLKLLCAAAVIAANGVAIVAVEGRRRALATVSGAPLDDPRIRFWQRVLFSSFLAIPFAVGALWFAVVRS